VGVAIIYQQYQEVNEKYPGLHLRCNESGCLWITGDFHFVADHHGEVIEDTYVVKIVIPEDYPQTIPEAQETGNRIPKDFHHYIDNTLCLGARYALRKAFRDAPTLLGFMENCLLPYLYSFSYKTRYGKLPAGELSHGWRGVLEYYQDLFQIRDEKAVLGLFAVLVRGNCGGHARCPCGSRKRIRDCHGNMLRNMLQVQPASTFEREYEILLTGIGTGK